MTFHRLLPILACSLTGLCVCASAEAVIRVRITPISGSPTTTDFSPGQNISITATSNTDQINIWSTTSTETIGRVTISGSGTNFVKVVIGSGAFNFTTEPGVSAAGDWAGLNATRDFVWLYGRIGGNLTNTINVGRVWAFTVLGQVQSGITDREGGPIHVRAGSFTASGNINAQFANIGLVEVTGNLLGDLVADVGDIITVDVDGDIGASMALSDISSAGVIDTITATNIYADIVAGSTTAATITTMEVSGDFNGSLDASSISSEGLISISGDLDATITFTNGLLADTEIRIGDSFASGASISLPENGLAGQIVINNNDSSGTWDGVVNVDDIELDDAGYPEAAADLGGGSVGLAPFHLHGESCEPFEGGLVVYDASLTSLVRHYGPVTFSSSPLTVGRRAARTTGSFTDVTSDFDFDAVTGDANSILVSKSTSGAGFEVGYEYLIEPTSNLKSAGVSGEPEVVDYDYMFTVVMDTCQADLNDDDVVNGDDLANLLSVWGGCASPCSADFNGDGVVNGADLAFLLSTWGACTESVMLTDETPEFDDSGLMPGGQARGNAGPLSVESDVPWIIAEFGFTSVQSYMNWINALDPEDVIEHILDVIDLLLGE